MPMGTDQDRWNDGAAGGSGGNVGGSPVSTCWDGHACLRWTVMVLFVPPVVRRRQIPHRSPTCRDKGTLQSVYVDGKQPKVERCKSEREEGSKISRDAGWIPSDPLNSVKMPHSRRNARTTTASRALDISARPDTHGIWHASQVPSTDLVTHNSPQGPEPV